MKRILLIALSLSVLIIGSGMAFAEDNVTDDLSSVESDVVNSNVSVSGTSFSDVQNTINKASAGDTVMVEGTFTSNKKAIDIKKPLTIQGKNGATFDAKKLSSVFTISSDNIVLKDLTIKNSYDSAIMCEYNEKAFNLKIINCTFTGNGGGFDGGIIFDANKGDLTIINSTFTNNRADYGGAIYSGDNLNVIGSTFTGNVGKYEGGAIFFTGQKLNVTDCIFTNNRASKDDGGGAIDAGANDLFISNSVFTGNSAVYGGAISLTANNAIITDCNFTSNTASKDGGAIYSSGGLDLSEKIISNIIITNSNFKGSTAKGKGNSVFADATNLDISNSSFDKKSYDVYAQISTLKSANNINLNSKIVNTLKGKMTGKALKTTYYSLKPLRVSIHDDWGHEFYGYKVKVKIKTATKTKVYYTNAHDEYSFVNLYLSTLPVGKYKVKVTLKSKYFKVDAFSTKVTIKQAKTIVKAPKLTAKYKKSKLFRVKIKNKATHFNVKKLKIKIKVYTGKKAKSFIVKTDKKGIASINTKSLKRGYHKVVITSKNKNYNVNKKSSIIIR